MNTNILKKQQQDAIPSFINLIVDSILDKKGHNIVSLNLVNIEDAMTDYFIICEGNSPPQVKAIADNILFNVKEKAGELPTSTEGFKTLDWVLIDYFDVVIHIFHKDRRDDYALEELWGDAAISTQYLPDGTAKVIKNKPFLSKAD